MDRICIILENVASVFYRMHSYVIENKGEILKVSKNFLENKGITLDQYIESIHKENFPLDELFLILFAKIFHVHVGVILSNNGFWCNAPWIPSRQCAVIFMFTKSTTSAGKLELTLCAKCLKEA